nr:caspase family protein [uncultured Rhodopila sp.]
MKQLANVLGGLAIVAGLLLGSNAANAYGITAILIASPVKASGKDPVPTGAERSAGEFDGFLREVARRVGADYKSITVKGQDFDWNKIKARIEAIDVASDDVVFVYYAGHGAHPTGDPTEFPSMTLPDNGYISESYIANLGTLKKARLSVVVFDTCNILVRAAAGSPRESSLEGINERNYNVVVVKSLKRMFSSGPKQILLAGQREGDFSYFDENGGWYTDHLINAFLDPFADKVYGWDVVLARADKEFEVPNVTATQRPVSSPRALAQ